MKQLTLIMIFTLMLFSGCSKQANTDIAGGKIFKSHSIKISITASADFSVNLSTRKNEETIREILDDKTSTNGKYDFTTTQNETNFIYAEIKSAGGGTLSYTINKDGNVVAQKTDQPFNARVNIEYEIR